MNIIKTENLTKIYNNDGVSTTALKNINLEIKKGDFVSIMGKSGAGKSTLLHQISLLDDQTSGKIYVNDFDTSALSQKEKTDFRLENFGYIFQDYALLPELNAVENVALPLLMKGVEMKKAIDKARESLERVGLGNRLQYLPSKLSGGEQQRVSIARAIANEPKIIFADEPTASLDSRSSKLVLDTFLELNRQGETIIMVTHELEYGNLAQKMITLSDGEILCQVCGDRIIKNT